MCSNVVYGYSTNRNLYIFEKASGKLLSFVGVPFERVEINGMKVS
jgi:hypothetical protein